MTVFENKRIFIEAERINREVSATTKAKPISGLLRRRSFEQMFPVHMSNYRKIIFLLSDSALWTELCLGAQTIFDIMFY